MLRKAEVAKAIQCVCVSGSATDKYLLACDLMSVVWIKRTDVQRHMVASN